MALASGGPAGLVLVPVWVLALVRAVVRGAVLVAEQPEQQEMWQHQKWLPAPNHLGLQDGTEARLVEPCRRQGALQRPKWQRSYGAIPQRSQCSDSQL